MYSLDRFEPSPALRDPILDVWQPLYRCLDGRSKRRNWLAHFDMQRDSKGKPGYRFHLQPNAHDMKAERRYKYKPPRYNLCQITAWGNSFEKLGEDLIAFSEKLPRSFMDPALKAQLHN